MKSIAKGTARMENAPTNWALVGSADHKTGFVLSRTPQLPDADLNVISRTVIANGFDLCAFRVTVQDGGAQRSQPVC